MNTQQERDRQNDDDQMKGTQSDSTRSENRQAASLAGNGNDNATERRDTEGNNERQTNQDGSHAEGQYDKGTSKPEVQKDGPLK